jgi:hypothetical protein
MPTRLLPAALGLTFDVRGDRKWAQPACGRPLDGGVRHRVWLAKRCHSDLVGQELNWISDYKNILVAQPFELHI